MAGETIIIRSEADAWQLLDDVLKGRVNLEDVSRILVRNWEPELLYFPNEVGHTVNPSIVRALDELYKNIQKSYLRTVYQTTKKKLTEDDREALNLRISLKSGSNKIDAPSETVEKILNKMISKMSGKQVAVTALGVALIYFASSSFDHWVSEQAKAKDIEALVAMDTEVTKRAEIMANAMENITELKAVKEDADESKNALLKTVTFVPQAKVGGVAITQEEAKILVKKDRVAGEGKRIDGRYLVQKIEAQTGKEEFTVRIKNVETNQEFSVEVNPLLLPKEDFKIVFDALMNIHANHVIDIVGNAWYVGDRISHAAISRVNSTKREE